MFNELKTAYGVLIFYTLLMMITATVGYKMDTKDGFTKGYIVGMVISVVLWFSVGKKYSNL